MFGQVLSSGRNLVSKALADGDIEGLKRALQAMPRGMRTRSALEIDVDDNIVSPILWSIQDGQLALTEVLLQDVLAIRGDRDHYYYGRCDHHCFTGQGGGGWCPSFGSEQGRGVSSLLWGLWWSDGCFFFG